MDDRDPLPRAFLERLDRLAETYLESDDPRLQSGFGGGAKRWREEREPILEAIDRDGELLDIGCANGLLLQDLVAWAAERSLRLQPFGLDQSEGLVRLAKARMPEFADHFAVGNAWSWDPPRQFDFVYSLADVVPPSRLTEYLKRVFGRAVRPGGSLILGSYGSRSRGIDPIDVDAALIRAGLRVAGSASAGEGPLVRFAWSRAGGGKEEHG